MTGSESFYSDDEALRLSAQGKFWRFHEKAEIDEEIIEAASGSPLLAHFLHLRGAQTLESVKSFLDSEVYEPASPMELPDVDRAVMRITEAIAAREKITIYGDYDVDGVTGTSVLLTVLRKLGAVVDFYIPNRAAEGYGLNLKAVSILASKQRTKLIISCDCGVSNFAEITFAKSFGIDTLVLDHHSMPDMLPPAVGIVHPKRLPEDHPLFHLPGVGVAYKVCEALLIDRGMSDEVPELLDYVTLGMIADLVPLIRENRYLVKIGLPRLINSKRPGIQALLAQVRKSEDTDIVGFGLAPRINAVGRLADAKIAVELLTTDDEEVAATLARQLQIDNTRRQELCEQIYIQAESMVQTKLDLDRDRAIVIYDEGWHHGVVGIVASRLVERFNRPVFIGELDPAEGIVKGSARSIDSVDLYEVLRQNEHLMVKFGGHKMAAGFSLEAAKAEIWARALTDTCNRMLADSPLKANVDVEAIVEVGEITESVAELITQLAPFGMWNKKPLLCAKSVSCTGTRVIGKDGKHHRIMLEDLDNGAVFECVMWNTRGNVPSENQVIDVVFSPEINVFNGRKRLQLVLSDWRDSNKKVFAPSIGSAVASQVMLNIGSGPHDQARTVAVASEELVLRSGPARSHSDKAAAAHILSSNPEADAPDLDALEELNLPHRNLTSTVAQKLIWKDLRHHENANEIIERALAKLGNSVNLFSEIPDAQKQFNFVDRMTLTKAPHLLICQFPASAAVFQELLMRSATTNIYLLGHKVDKEEGDPAAYLRKLTGLVKFAINKREGQVNGEKLAALLGSTKMSVALALTILKRVNLIDWYSEDGEIFLDMVGTPTERVDETPEYKQLLASLNSAQDFRSWCGSASLKELQLKLMPNLIELAPQASASDSLEATDQQTEYTNEHSNERERSRISPSS